jgi:hypothetical protein
MKAWFTKFKISAALDSGARPEALSQPRTSVSDELRSFEQEMTVLDRTLKQTAPKPRVPPTLHASIMRAVRATELPLPQARPELSWLRWLPMSAVAVLAVLVVWYVARSPLPSRAQDTQSLAAATTALDLSGQVARAVPSAVVAPLADELDKVNRDLDNTAQFILASLP